MGAVSAVGTRVYWDERPQGKQLPDICFQAISKPREYHMKGAQAVQWVRVQADCRSLDYLEALASAEALIAEMEQPKEIDGFKFLAAEAEGPVDRGEQTETDFVHRQQVDLMFYYSIA